MTNTRLASQPRSQHSADAYYRDAAVAVETAEALVLARRLTAGEG